MGELDVSILIELFGGQQMARALAPSWNGGIYYAAQRKSATTVAQKESTDSIALLYSSRWKNADSARSFLRVYTAQLPRKYSHVSRRPKDEADDSEQVYSTNEGDVLISTSGSGVFITEGFPLNLARKLHDSVTSLQNNGPLQVVQTNPHELSLGIAHTLQSFGMIKAMIPQRYTFPEQK